MYACMYVCKYTWHPNFFTVFQVHFIQVFFWHFDKFSTGSQTTSPRDTTIDSYLDAKGITVKRSVDGKPTTSTHVGDMLFGYDPSAMRTTGPHDAEAERVMCEFLNTCLLANIYLRTCMFHARTNFC
ncbi:unnamed protein product [Ceratitis capitata]|uniref:(Mediterranean fruit fly) hypothetical protein n=1 Tax=Ceratitis capitata TaxID=7213 RepID=A0A811VA93_CERCA|nr:unnamed protein product [Ceratitis capitata]